LTAILRKIGWSHWPTRTGDMSFIQHSWLGAESWNWMNSIHSVIQNTLKYFCNWKWRHWIRIDMEHRLWSTRMASVIRWSVWRIPPHCEKWECCFLRSTLQDASVFRRLLHSLSTALGRLWVSEIVRGHISLAKIRRYRLDTSYCGDWPSWYENVFWPWLPTTTNYHKSLNIPEST
jgi:hypothetical protein